MNSGAPGSFALTRAALSRGLRGSAACPGDERKEERVNEPTVFRVVRAESHEAAARLFEGRPHCTIYPCDAVEGMPVLGT